METNFEQANQQGDGIQKTEENPNGQSTQTTSNSQDGDSTKAVDVELQWEYTRTRQALIDSTTKLVELNGAELHSIQDVKLRDSVAKRLYNMTYAEAEAVFGKGFNSNSKKEEEDDKSSWDSIEREIRLLKYREKQREIDMAIDKFKLLNPTIQVDSNIEWKIRDEIGNISEALPAEERVKRAATVALGSPLDTTSIAYKLLNQTKLNGGNGGQRKVEEPKEVDDKTSALKSYMLGRIK